MGSTGNSLSTSASVLRAWIVVLCVGVVVSHLLGATLLKSVLWGSNGYGFLPLPTAVAVVVLALAIPFAALRLGGSWAAAKPGLLTWTAVLALAGAMFWVFRIRHALLGDSGPLSHNLPLGEATHPRQPLSMWIHHLAYGWGRAIFERRGTTPQEVGFDTAALDSVVAGVLFVPVAWWLAGRLVSRAGWKPGTPGDLTRVLATGVLLAQGFVQLFFGYVENYTWFTLAMAGYLLTGLLALEDRAPVVLPAAILACACGLNLSGVGLLPSLVALLGLIAARRGPRVLARDVPLVLLVFAGLQILLSSLGGFSTLEGLRYIWLLVAEGEATNRSLAYLLTSSHWRDFLAVQLLIGPFAGLALLPIAAVRLASPSRRDPRLLFLLSAAIPCLVAAWMYGDSIQGIARDWDLFAPFAVVFTAAALHGLLAHPFPDAQRRALLAAVLAVSLLHTGAWVALNTSEARSLERSKVLPSAKGRSEIVVATWYYEHGKKALAREWFEKALRAYPDNNVAHHHLGLLAMDEGRYDEAIRHFERAIEIRPDRTMYRLSLADAFVISGRTADAVPQLEALIRAEPNRAKAWGCLALVHMGLGRWTEARAELDRALALDPRDPRYAKLAARLGDPRALERAIEAGDWDALVLD